MSRKVYIDGYMNKAHKHDAGYDLESAIDVVIPPKTTVKVPSSVARISLPEGTVGLLTSRSGLSINKNIVVVNSPGIIDCGYKSKVIIGLRNLNEEESFEVKKGDRLAQFLIINLANDIEVVTSENDEYYSPVDERNGINGIGSSGTDSRKEQKFSQLELDF